MSCSLDRAKSKGKGFDYSFWFQFDNRIVAEKCTIAGLKVRYRLLKGRARCEICSVRKFLPASLTERQRGRMKAPFVLPPGLDSLKCRVAASERLRTCLILKALTIRVPRVSNCGRQTQTVSLCFAHISMRFSQRTLLWQKANRF